MNAKKNIVVFMTDQQNGTTIGQGGLAKTPNLDAFLAGAVHFTRSYCPAPHCCPSRASFFTGLYPSQHGVWNNVEVDNAISRGLYDGVVLFPELLRGAGYHTIFSGKWHVSGIEGPLDRGFDTVLHEFIQNFERSKVNNVPHINDWKHTYADRARLCGANEEKRFGCIAREGYPLWVQFGTDPDAFGDGITTSRACRTIEEYDDERPLFLFVGTTGPHDPYMPPAEFLEWYPLSEVCLPETFCDDLRDKPNLYRRTREQYRLSEKEHRESIRSYLAMCSYEDYLFGKLLQSIKKRGLEEDTLIVYLSDHGDYMGNHGLWGKGLPCFDEAYRICAAVGGAGIKGGTVCDEFISLADFAPTILELAGCRTDIAFTGRSLTPFLQGEKPSAWRKEMFTQTNGNEAYGIQRAVFDRQWKYVMNYFDYDELYDLKKDPHEMKNVIDSPENAPVIREMNQKIWSFAKQTGDGCTCPYLPVSFSPYGPGIAE